MLNQPITELYGSLLLMNAETRCRENLTTVSATKSASTKSTATESTVIESDVPDSVPSACTDREDSPGQWCAELALGIDVLPNHGSRLTHNRHRGPLRVQKPFYPEGRECAHIYLLHPPGGLVSGDSLDIDIKLSRQAQALVTTPGAGKVYAARKNGTRQRQDVELTLDKGAAIEWFPQESIVFNGAEASLNTRIELAQNAVFIGWDIICLGRPASGAAFETGSFEQRYQFWRNKKLRFTERLVISSTDRVKNSACGLNRQPVTGTFFATFAEGENNCDLVRELRYRCQAYCEAANGSGEVAVTLVRDLCIVRYLGDNTERAKMLFQSLWQLLRPRLLQREVCVPRIWRT